MKEYEPLAGDHIDRACATLVSMAPAFMKFNDVRIEALGGESAGDLVATYHAEMDRLRAKLEAEQCAFDATPEGQRRIAEAKRAADEEKRRQDEARASIDRSGVRTKYPWREGMGQISGFGGGYEEACRTMLYAGLAKLWDLAWEWNEKAIDAALIAVEPGCSGAMHGAVMGACRFIQRNGWEKYAAEMTKGGAS